MKPQHHETGTEVKRSRLVTRESAPVQIPVEGNGMTKARGPVLLRLNWAGQLIPACFCFSDRPREQRWSKKKMTSRYGDVQHEEVYAVGMHPALSAAGQKPDDMAQTYKAGGVDQRMEEFQEDGGTKETVCLVSQRDVLAC